jgi:hypothetical protein
MIIDVYCTKKEAGYHMWGATRLASESEDPSGSDGFLEEKNTRNLWPLRGGFTSNHLT